MMDVFLVGKILLICRNTCLNEGIVSQRIQLFCHQRKKRKDSQQPPQKVFSVCSNNNVITRAVSLNQHFCVPFFFDQQSGLPCGFFVDRKI
jgi:hypothetical protein